MLERLEQKNTLTYEIFYNNNNNNNNNNNIFKTTLVQKHTRIKAFKTIACLGKQTRKD